MRVSTHALFRVVAGTCYLCLQASKWICIYCCRLGQLVACFVMM